MLSPLARTARSNVESIVRVALELPRDRQAFLLFDRESQLATILSDSYLAALPGAQAIEFEEASRDEILRRAFSLSAGELVVLVESSRFPLAAHRFRVELFERGLKVIEHPHLARIQDGEIGAYVDSLAYDASYYRTLGPSLKSRIDRAANVTLEGNAGDLVYRGPLEEAKLNIGDYAGQSNVGGQFPIGEVFTEARDLTAVSG
ncbi:MAG: hypothetical protein ACRD16_17275, partial [Thermoanaerobaculia bacterium]